MPGPNDTAVAHETIDLPITGMTCGSCATRIERGLGLMPGIRTSTVNYAAERATLSIDRSQLAAVDVVQKVRELGYDVAATQTDLEVDGMTCGACAARVQKALRKLPDVVGADVNFTTGSARVSHLASVTAQEVAAGVDAA